MKIWVRAILVVLMAVTLGSAAPKDSIYSINGRIPLGIESFRLQPGSHPFYLMASAMSPAFDGIYRRADSRGLTQLYDAHNNQWQFYPTSIQFRVTASSRERMAADHPFDTRAKIGLDKLFTKLHFRLKVFHALQYRYIDPASVQEIGVPESIDYNERIYRIDFDLGKIPIENRIVMEVLAPNGERLCKFHLDLL